MSRQTSWIYAVVLWLPLWLGYTIRRGSMSTRGIAIIIIVLFVWVLYGSCKGPSGVPSAPTGVRIQRSR